MLVRVLVILLLLTTTASAWEIKTSGPVTITGEGALPTLTPSVVPPVIPPPVVPPPPVPPIVDRTPFAFPTDCPRQPVNFDERYRQAWDLPGKAPDAVDRRVYAYADGAGNPSPLSHTCLGIFQPGVMSPDGKEALGNLRAWGPISAGTEQPWQLRCILATGRLCP